MSDRAKKLTGNLFILGLVAIAIEAIAYLFSLPHTGIAFCVGMALCLSSCILSILLGEKAKKEDMVTILAGLAFFGWLIARSL